MLKSSLTERLFIPHLVRVTQDINDGDSCPACPLLGQAAGPRGTWGEAVRLEPPQTGALGQSHGTHSLGGCCWSSSQHVCRAGCAECCSPGGDCAIWLFW